MSDKMREQFEEWAKHLPLANLERHLDGYVNQHINSYWATWQASRAALVVELPEKWPLFTVDEVKDILDLAGVKYK